MTTTEWDFPIFVLKISFELTRLIDAVTENLEAQ